MFMRDSLLVEFNTHQLKIHCGVTGGQIIICDYPLLIDRHADEWNDRHTTICIAT